MTPPFDFAEIERRLRDDRRVHLVIAPPSRLERIFDFLGRTFGETPRGFVGFVGLLFPIAVAGFCIGYFGLRELLAGFGL